MSNRIVFSRIYLPHAIASSMVPVGVHKQAGYTILPTLTSYIIITIMKSLLVPHRLRIYQAVLAVVFCLMSLTAFDCQPAEDPCDPECSDNNATLCVAFPPAKQMCHCQCAFGDVVILIYESGELIDRRQITSFTVPRDFGSGERWCSLPTITTCRNLRVEVALVCKDGDCYNEIVEVLESPYVMKIPCGETKNIWATFGCLKAT